MTVSSGYVPPQYNGDGVTRAFAFPYPFFTPSDLVPTLLDTTTNLAVSPAPVLNGSGTYDFTVSGVRDTDTGEYLSGATVTLNNAPPASYKITLTRNVQAVQNTALTNNAPFPAKTIEAALDRLTMVDQQLTVGNGGTVTIISGGGGGGASVPVSAAMTPVVEASTTTDALALLGGATTMTSVAALRASSSATPAFFLEGYYGPADGGEGWLWYDAADTTTADDGVSVFVNAAGHRFHRANGGFITAKQAGAKGDGATDDTAALGRWLGMANAGTLILTPGTYLVSGALSSSASNMLIVGASDQSTIATNSATADILDLTGSNIVIRDLAFSSSVTRTAGAYVTYSSNNGQVYLENCAMTGWYNGIVINGTGGSGPASVKISKGRLISSAAGGAGITVNSGVDLEINSTLISGTSSGQQPTYGVLVTKVGDLTLNHVQTVYGGSGLAVIPAAGQAAQCVVASDCLFDSGSGSGIVAGGAGTTQLLKICNTWACTNTQNGLQISPATGGVIQQVDAVECTFSNNQLNGIAIGTGSISNVTLIDCTAGSNAQSGIGASGQVTGLQVIGGHYGASGQFSGNGLYGISLPGAGSAYVTLAGADCTGGNVSGPGNVSGLTGADCTIVGCPGLTSTVGGGVTSVAGYTGAVTTGNLQAAGMVVGGTNQTRIEAGQAGSSAGTATVNFSPAFSFITAFVATPVASGAGPFTIQLTNLTTTAATLATYDNGAAATITFNWVAVGA